MSKIEQENEKYTPTRLEWLIVFMSAISPNTATLQRSSIEYALFPSEDAQTIIILVRHYRHLPTSVVEEFIEKVKALIIKVAEFYGWESWVNIQVEYEVLDTPKKESS